MNKIQEMIFQLYNNENISIGVHGTGILPDEEQKKAKEICRKGLMCRYGDIRRTVALQNRGMIHAHGNISFEELISYGYGKGSKGYLYEVEKEGKRITYIPKTIDLEQCSFIIAIPEEMRTTDEEIFCGPKQKFKKEYATDESELRVGTYNEQQGRPINPKYIVGYYMNGDITTFIHNSKFYGFKEEKDGEFPQIDLEKIEEENERIKQINAERAGKSIQELGKETIEKQKQTSEKKGIFKILDRLINLTKSKSNLNKNER